MTGSVPKSRGPNRPRSGANLRSTPALAVMAITKRAHVGGGSRAILLLCTNFYTQIPKWLWERMSYIVR